MITSNYRWRTRRILRWALVLSLLAHLLIGIFYFAAQPWAKVALSHILPMPKPTPDQIVTVSNALTIDKKPKVRGLPVHRPARRVVAQMPQPRAVQAVPVPVVHPQPVPLVTPVPKPPSRERHEIAKLVPKAPAQAPKTVREKIVTQVPTAPPATPLPQTAEVTPPPVQRRARTETEKQIASLQKSEMEKPVQPSHANPALQPHQLSEEQLARINSDLAKSIAQDRAENNPLNAKSYATPASSVKRYPMQMLGIDGRMRGSQGLCDPIKSWSGDDGYDYYYVTCHAVFTDGFTDDEPVPWPVRFKPNDDPYRGTGPTVPRPLALPLPGWTLPAGVSVGEGVRGYAKEHGVNL